MTSFLMDHLLALWSLLILASLVTCKVWSLDLYLKRLLVYILLQNSIKHACSIRAWVPVSLSLSLSLSPSPSLYFWLIPWSAKASFVTQGILASFLLSLSHRQLRTTRFQSIKGPQQVDSLVLSFPRTVRELGLRLQLSSKISACRARDTGDESSISG